MKIISKVFFVLHVALLFSNCSKNNGESNQLPTNPQDPGIPPVTDLKIGAYYFGGWYPNSNHYLNSGFAQNLFSERAPIWGWNTNQQAVIEQQINTASAYGIHFFSFCWYFDPPTLTDNRPANDAVKNFRTASNKSKMKFNLMVSNHDSYEIKPTMWPALTQYWLNAFKDPSYLVVDNKPVIIFFEFASLRTNWISLQALKDSLNSLRNEAKALGFDGATIGICTGPKESQINAAIDCGFDFLTGYNWSGNAFSDAGKNTDVPIEKMSDFEFNNYWNLFKNRSIPFAPLVTLNFDNRPWSKPYPNRTNDPRYFTGYGKASVANSISRLKLWMNDNLETIPKGKLAFLYAWNEYGEGGWLSPSEPLKDSLLRGFSEGLK